MQAGVRSGPAIVVAHGTVTAFAGHGLELSVEVDGEPVVVDLAFRSDPDVEDVDIDSTYASGQVAFELTNFDAADGRGSAVPVLVAEREDHVVFFHFRVFRYGRTPDRTVHYTFYRVARKDLGWTQPGSAG